METAAASSWQSNVTAIGSIITPFLVMLLTAVGWKIRTGINRRNELEDKLREERIKVYNIILEPFILILMPEAAWQTDPKNKNRDKGKIADAKLLSLVYRENAFNMSLVGSDAVVRAYNNLMQYFYTLGTSETNTKNVQVDEPGKEPDKEEQVKTSSLKEMIVLLGKFLLEIRKSMGNESTKLDYWDMLEWWMTDARKLKSGEIDI